MGVYTMPSFDEEPFQITTEFDAPPAVPFEQPHVSRFRPDVIVGIEANPTRRFDARAQHVDPVVPAEPVLQEFLDESEIVEEFAAASRAPLVEAVAASASTAPAVETWQEEAEVPAPVQPRDTGWINTGLRSAWAWPNLEGVNVEPPAPRASIDELSDILAPPAPVRQPAARPASAPPRSQPAAAGPASPASAAKPASTPAKPAAAPPKPAAPAAAAKPDHMEWAELVASLRQDIERRRNQPAQAAAAVAAAPAPRQPAPAPAVAAEVPRKRKSTPVQDEWGFFDPEQCGFAALLAKLDEFSDGAEEKDVRQPS